VNPNFTSLRRLAMLYSKNLPVWERWLRTGAGAALAGAGTGILVTGYRLVGIPSAVLGTVGVLTALTIIGTALFGWCPACALGGRRPRP
jgi:hypothetical protein